MTVFQFATQRNLLLLSVFLCFTLFNCNSPEQEKEPTRIVVEKPAKKEPTITTQYVFANSGLNLREAPDLNSDVIIRLALGKRVKVYHDEASSTTMTIEGLEGKMVKVKSEGKSGYVFSGFLVPYPVPVKNDFWSYANKLQLDGLEVDYVQTKSPESDSSFLELNQSLQFPGEPSRDRWQNFYLIAKKLGFMNFEKVYDFPFPGPENEGLLTNLITDKKIKNDSKERNHQGHWVETYRVEFQDSIIWYVEVKVTYDNGNNLLAIQEYQRTEGSGSTTTLKWQDDQYILKQNSFAD